MRPLRFLFATCDWGLGHATRDLLLIRALLDAGHAVHILSHGRALELLQQELKDRCTYASQPDIPKPLSRWPFMFYTKMTFCVPLIYYRWWQDRLLAREIAQSMHIDRIVSDSRYGISHPDLPSFCLLHSLRQIVPVPSTTIETMVEAAQKRMLAGMHKILIPDQEAPNLAGHLCHDVACDWGNRLAYIGILSSLQRQPLAADLDYFISISGAEPQRTLLEQKIMAQAFSLPGRVVLTRGRPDLPFAEIQRAHVTIYTHLNRQRQQEMMNRAKLVITRSGYTTLMELAELGKKALLIPTPGQSEQEYLAAYHERQGHLHAVLQKDLHLIKDVQVAGQYPGLPNLHPTATSAQRFLELVTA
jgi:UDP-N-acetylglucosamine transferase subunit ALG13